MNYTASITEAPYNFDLIAVMTPTGSPIMCVDCLLIFDKPVESTVYSMKIPRKKIEYKGRGIKSFNQSCCPRCGSNEIDFL